MSTVFDTRPCELGEGPFWHPERSQPFWFDIQGKRLLSRDAQGPLDWSLKEQASAAGWIDHDTLLMATETGLYKFEIQTGKRSLIKAIEADQGDTRSNDGRADPRGGFWIGTMGKRAQPRAGAIYRYFGGRTEKLFDQITIPNAICFSPDGGRAYFADTPRRRIWTVGLDQDGWPDGPSEVFVDLREAGENPDGAVTDAEGALWVAKWGAGRVTRYLPDGRAESDLNFAAIQTTCPCFIGANLDQLLVTSAWEGLNPRSPMDGQTFVADPKVPGRPEPRVMVP